MTKPLALAFLLAVACSGEAAAPATPPTLQHHQIDPASLPRPFDTPSAGNPPGGTSSPSNWTPTVAPGYRIALFASGLDDPRNMIQAPNGDILVAESSNGDVKILRGQQRITLARGLDYPYGLALRGNTLYIGCENAVVTVPYPAGGAAKHIVSLPGGGHTTRNVIFNRDGSKMFVSIGSESNVSREDPPRAAVMQYNADGSGARVFAYGLRNPVGLAWNPKTGALWTVVNERDGLGDDLVPDYATDLRDGGFYGWPYSYIGANEDPRRAGERRDLVAKAIVPSVLIASHSAPIGLTFDKDAAYVALHGSWNRAKRTGYKVIRIPMRDGKSTGGYDDFVVGWLPNESGRSVYGRPAGVLALADGSLLVSDDANGVIWRVTKTP